MTMIIGVDVSIKLITNNYLFKLLNNKINWTNVLYILEGRNNMVL
jgi:hypothetical protein